MNSVRNHTWRARILVGTRARARFEPRRLMRLHHYVSAIAPFLLNQHLFNTHPQALRAMRASAARLQLATDLS